MPAAPKPHPQEATERRRAPRTQAEVEERSRQLGQTMEFTCLGLVVCAFAFGLSAAIQEAFAHPLEQIQMALK